VEEGEREPACKQEEEKGEEVPNPEEREGERERKRESVRVRENKMEGDDLRASERKKRRGCTNPQKCVCECEREYAS